MRFFLAVTLSAFIATPLAAQQVILVPANDVSEIDSEEADSRDATRSVPRGARSDRSSQQASTWNSVEQDSNSDGTATGTGDAKP